MSSMIDRHREIAGGHGNAYDADRPSNAEVITEMLDEVAGLEDGSYDPPMWATREEAIDQIRQQIEQLVQEKI